MSAALNCAPTSARSPPAPTPVLQPADDDLEERVQREALFMVLSHAPSSVPLLWLAVGVLLLYTVHLPALWPVSMLLAAMAVVSGLWRLRIHWQARRSGLRTRSLRLAAMRQVRANAMLAGLLWLVSTVALFPGLDLEGREFHIILLAGTAAITSFYIALIGRYAELLICAMMLPLSGMLALHPDLRSWPLATMTLAFCAALLRNVGSMRQTTLAALRLKHEAEANAEQLRQAMQAAQAGAQAKARFLATMSHEIRTPMNGVLGALDLLNEGTLSPSQRHLLDVARSSGQGLLAVLNDTLDFSKIDAGHVDLRADPVSLQALVIEVHALFAASASARQLSFRAELDPALPAQVLADAQRLKQVLINLVANAVKFTPRGEVCVAVKALPSVPASKQPDAGEGAPAASVLFAVTDTGIGIAADRIDQLFTPFQQIDQGPQRSFGGSGLGLAISHRLVERMGSHIAVDSTIGVGSRFSFHLSLPVCPATETAHVVAETTAAPESLRGSVLLAEDNSVNSLIAVAMLRSLGLTVTQVADGADALTALAQQRPDLVLMDGQMPVMDGYAATRRWRALEAQQAGLPRLPVIALTANALPEDHLAAREAGMDDLLAKPYTREQLARMLARWLPPA
ncbi:MAG: hybrid sensor histidine kinase/response regulator [Burkholderiales bacterium PBB6]|nr:MAG: hybrid sensor histidine kinase/response regulator [Burkholderiales bacterium PBB6]